VAFVTDAPRVAGSEVWLLDVLPLLPAHGLHPTVFLPRGEALEELARRQAAEAARRAALNVAPWVDTPSLRTFIAACGAEITVDKTMMASLTAGAEGQRHLADLAHVVVLREQGLVPSAAAERLVDVLREADTVAAESFGYDPEHGELVPRRSRELFLQGCQDPRARFEQGDMHPALVEHL
jgi:hypothetical protein